MSRCVFLEDTTSGAAVDPACARPELDGRPGGPNDRAACGPNGPLTTWRPAAPGSVFTCRRVRREALLIEWRWETFASVLSQQGGEAGEAWSGRCRVGWQAAPTKPGRVSTARWRGSGERGGKAYVRNRREHAPQVPPARNLADLGRERCAPARGGELFGWLSTTGRETTVKCCGVAVVTAAGTDRRAARACSGPA